VVSSRRRGLSPTAKASVRKASKSSGTARSSAARPSRWWLRVLIVLAAIGAAVAPTNAGVVDAWYSRGVYGVLQPIVTSISSLLPFALLDALIGGALLWIGLRVWRITRAGGPDRRRAIGRFALDAIAAVALVYLLFLALWGLNYRRLPVTTGLDYDAARVTQPHVDALGRRAVAELNRLHASAHALLPGVPTLAAVRVRLAPAFADAQRQIGAAHLATPGRPKWSIVSPFFRLAGVDGMVNPLGLEVLVNPDVLPIERPFVVAHEWGHLAGWAKESEASLVGWVTCQDSDDLARYSAWLDLYLHLGRDVTPAARSAMTSALAQGPRGDLAGIAARLERVHPSVARASWQTYDRFLKANRVPEGIRSYDEVVQLVVGTSADQSDRPALVRR
jgi:hypothetical protein